MKERQNDSSTILWWVSATLMSGIHIYLIWLLSHTHMPPPDADISPVAMMLALSTEPEFSQNVEQESVMGISQNINEPPVEPVEHQPEAANQLVVAPEHSNASLIVEKKVDTSQKEPTKAERRPQKVTKPRQPIKEPPPESSTPAMPAVATSTPLSGESHQVAAAANSDSLQNQQSHMNWRSRLQGHLAGFKRYPPTARKQRQQGTAIVHFAVNQEGYVLATKLIKSSGVAALDREALAVIKRAQPLPQPPAELLLNKQITLIVPVVFDLKNNKR